MLIAGAKGHAIEVLEMLFKKYGDQLSFFDDFSTDLPPLLFGRFKLHRTLSEVASHFKENPDFILGIGNPHSRRDLAAKLKKAGGKLRSAIADNATVGSFNVNFGEGLNIMDGVFISNNVTIGEGALINAHSLVHHDCMLGDYIEIGPGSIITGRCKIGDNASLGAGCIVRPGVIIGKNVIIGAGSVVLKNVEDNVMVMGVPAKEKQQ